MLLLLLPEGHASETRVPFSKQCFFFQNGGALDGQAISLFRL